MKLHCIPQGLAIRLFMVLLLAIDIGCSNLVSVARNQDYPVPSETKDLCKDKRAGYQITLRAYGSSDRRNTMVKKADAEVKKFYDDFGLTFVHSANLKKGDFLIDISLVEEGQDLTFIDVVEMTLGLFTINLIPVSTGQVLYTKVKIYTVKGKYQPKELIGTYSDVTKWEHFDQLFISDDPIKNFDHAFANSFQKIKSDMVEDYVFAD